MNEACWPRGTAPWRIKLINWLLKQLDHYGITKPEPPVIDRGSIYMEDEP